MTLDSSRLPLAVTLGDPAGIGPEVALRAVTRPDAPRTILIGPPVAAARTVWRGSSGGGETRGAETTAV